MGGACSDPALLMKEQAMIPGQVAMNNLTVHSVGQTVTHQEAFSPIGTDVQATVASSGVWKPEQVSQKASVENFTTTVAVDGPLIRSTENLPSAGAIEEIRVTESQHLTNQVVGGASLGPGFTLAPLSSDSQHLNSQAQNSMQYPNPYALQNSMQFGMQNSMQPPAPYPIQTPMEIPLQTASPAPAASYYQVTYSTMNSAVPMPTDSSMVPSRIDIYGNRMWRDSPAPVNMATSGPANLAGAPVGLDIYGNARRPLPQAAPLRN